MQQWNPAENLFEKHQNKTRKEKFLDEMDRVIPRKELTKAKEPQERRQRWGIKYDLHIELAPRLLLRLVPSPGLT